MIPKFLMQLFSDLAALFKNHTSCRRTRSGELPLVEWIRKEITVALKATEPNGTTQIDLMYNKL